MKSFAVVTLASLAVLLTASTDAAVVIAKDCTQSERQLVNKLLQQDVNPAKACYSKAKGDITTLSTSRLCPIEECKVWLEYMSENAPNCVYDDTNYGTSFKAKAKDCGSTTSSSGSVAGDADAKVTKTPSTASTAGSSGDAGVVVVKTKAPVTAGSKASSSGSSGEDNTIEVPIIDNSTLTEPDVTSKPTTLAPVTPSPTKSAASSPFTSAVGALCAVSLSLAVLAF